LEGRQMLSSVPFGAMPMDTGEFMLGDVLVTVVLMESSDQNTSAVNPNTEDWRPETITAAKHKVVEGVRWWEQTLATQFPSNTAPLQFHFDFTHADTPVLTDFEPIANPSFVLRRSPRSGNRDGSSRMDTRLPPLWWGTTPARDFNHEYS
jgi:hypothetical protein